MKKIIAAVFILSLCACSPQNTPSMMNTTLPRVVPETTMKQIPIAQVNDGVLYKISSDYARYGSDILHLSLAYDPDSKAYTAMKAFHDLADVKAKLKKMGVKSMKAETIQSSGSAPTLMISYDSLTAQAPDGCQNMPGFDDGLTTREIGDYRFGCSVDGLLAKQIYRPADLLGNDTSDPIDGRRATNTVEHYRTVGQEEAEGDLDRFQRDDIQQ